MFDLASNGLDGRGDHVAAIGNRRSAEHDHQFGAGIKQLIDCLRKRPLLVRNAPLGDNLGSRRGNTRSRDLQGLFDDFGREPGQQRRHHANLAYRVGRNAYDGLCLDGCRHCFIAIGAVHRKGNNLYGSDHFPFDDGLEGRQCRHRDRFIDAVERVDRILVDKQDAGFFGK
jgi:hypothetical protein